MYKFIIYKDNKEVKTLEHQNSDFEPFKWLLNHQGQSINWALKYGGFEVEQINEETNETSFWNPYN
jgi:hypothetical protein